MKFYSTRDAEKEASLKEAILNSMPTDGGLYVPDDDVDLRKWILYANENTTFTSLAGSLTTAMLNDEFSPIICETIATRSFRKEPVLKQLDDNLFILELYHGSTGTFKDFGVAYLTSALETILQLDDEKAILLDATTGELGACMSKAMKDKHILKSILIAPKGKFRGMDEDDFVWNGGNIFPVEVDGTEEDCHNLVRKVFSDAEYVKKHNLTVANTANIGRLLPQTFFYTYAFSRLKKKVYENIYYAFSAGNYGNLISGLYAWKFALPVNGFIVPSTSKLTQDAKGDCLVLDSTIPIEKRNPADPSDPLNIERLEQVFKANSLMIKNFVFPASLTKDEIDKACRDLFVKYKIYADSETSAAYAASLKRNDIVDNEGSVVLLARENPYLDREFIHHNIGEEPEQTQNIKDAFKPVSLDRKPISPDDADYIKSIIESL